MPPTIPFSRRFYDTFGDDNTNELVNVLNAMHAAGLAELRSLNDTNFVRFDAKLEQRLAELAAGLRTEFREAVATLRTEFRESIAALRTEVRDAIGELRTESRTATADLRAHTDVGFAALRGEMAVGAEGVKTGFEALRKEVAQANTVALRWFIGLTVTALVSVLVALLGMVGR